jgi:hypothetical protein
MSKTETAKCVSAVFNQIVKHIKKDEILTLPESRDSEGRWVKRVYIDRDTHEMVVEFHDGTQVHVVVTE